VGSNQGWSRELMIGEDMTREEETTGR
jgi:hypothetical protein